MRQENADGVEPSIPQRSSVSAIRFLNDTAEKKDFLMNSRGESEQAGKPAPNNWENADGVEPSKPCVPLVKDGKMRIYGFVLSRYGTYIHMGKFELFSWTCHSSAPEKRLSFTLYAKRTVCFMTEVRFYVVLDRQFNIMPDSPNCFLRQRDGQFIVMTDTSRHRKELTVILPFSAF